MKTSKLSSSKTSHRQTDSVPFYQKFSAAAWGMVFWNPVPSQEVQSLHEQAMANHEEAQRTSNSAQDAIIQSQKILSSQ